MGRTTIEVKDVVRNELRSYKADSGLTYDKAILHLLLRGRVLGVRPGRVRRPC